MADPVPFVDLVRMHEPLVERFQTAFGQVVRSGRYHLGPHTKAFEQEFAAHEGASHGVGCASGSDALFLALRALNIGEGDAVVTVSNSFMATAESIARTGAQVIFAEPQDGTRCLDPLDLAQILGEPGAANIKAVIPVHLYGRRADIDGIRTVLDAANRNDIEVIGDAAQCHGSPGIASDTRLTCYSFYPAKNLGALGDSGMVLSTDEALAERIRGLRNHGRAGKHAVAEVGVNSRFDEIHAAILRIKLEVLNDWNQARRLTAEAYRTVLRDVPGVTLPEDDGRHVYHLFVIEVDPAIRGAVVAGLKQRGVGVGQHYPVATHQMPPYPTDRPLPLTERLCASVVSLPMFPGLRLDEVERVGEALRDTLHEAHT